MQVPCHAMPCHAMLYCGSFITPQVTNISALNAGVRSSRGYRLQGPAPPVQPERLTDAACSFRLTCKSPPKWETGRLLYLALVVSIIKDTNDHCAIKPSWNSLVPSTLEGKEGKKGTCMWISPSCWLMQLQINSMPISIPPGLHIKSNILAQPYGDDTAPENS